MLHAPAGIGSNTVWVPPFATFALYLLRSGFSASFDTFVKMADTQPQQTTLPVEQQDQAAAQQDQPSQSATSHSQAPAAAPAQHEHGSSSAAGTPSVPAAASSNFTPSHELSCMFQSCGTKPEVRDLLAGAGLTSVKLVAAMASSAEGLP